MSPCRSTCGLATLLSPTGPRGPRRGGWAPCAAPLPPPSPCCSAPQRSSWTSTHARTRCSTDNPQTNRIQRTLTSNNQFPVCHSWSTCIKLLLSLSLSLSLALAPTFSTSISLFPFLVPHTFPPHKAAVSQRSGPCLSPLEVIDSCRVYFRYASLIKLTPAPTPLPSVTGSSCINQLGARSIFSFVLCLVLRS